MLAAEPLPERGRHSPVGTTRVALCGESVPPDSREARQGVRPLNLSQPRQLLFGNGCGKAFAEHLATLGLKRLLLVTSTAVRAACADTIALLLNQSASVTIVDGLNREPTVAMLEACLARAREFQADGVIGFGGGSVLDVAKLVGALVDSEDSVESLFGSGLVKGRRCFLACLPTTSGTGSEVSPNAILLDETQGLKRAVISPHLVPDVAAVDPAWTFSVPPDVTATTGLDALTHCLEAYANQFAHPLVDLYALEGIRRIGRNLWRAVADGGNADARAQVALGSLYGGLCLGPVNTAAVHALAYPLGSDFGIPHGLSIALLLPEVLRFNLPAAPARYAEIALALGVTPGPTPPATAERGVRWLENFIADCPIPQRLSQCGVPHDALPKLAKSALTVTRLLKNNPRVVTEADALAIYEEAF